MIKAIMIVVGLVIGFSADAKTTRIFPKIVNGKAVFVYGTPPSLVSKPCDWRVYYIKVGACLVWRENYVRNPRFYTYYATRCYE